MSYFRILIVEVLSFNFLMHYCSIGFDRLNDFIDHAMQSDAP